MDGASGREWDDLRMFLASDTRRRWVPVGGGQKAPQMVEADGTRHGLKAWQEGKRGYDIPSHPHPDQGFGLCTGYGAVYAIDIDCDDLDTSCNISNALRSILGKVESVRMREGSARLGVLVEVAEWGEGRRKADLPQIALDCGGAVETLGRGNHLMAAGRHPSGAMVVWTDGFRPTKATAAQMAEFYDFCRSMGRDKGGEKNGARIEPEAVKRAMTAMPSACAGGERGAAKEIRHKVAALAQVGEGGRHDALISARASIARDLATERCNMSLEEAKALLMAACEANGYATDEPDICRRIIEETDPDKVEPRPEPWRDGAGGASDRTPASEPPAEWDTIPPPEEEHVSCGARIDCESEAARQLEEVVALHGKTHPKTGEVSLDCSVSCLVECLRRPAVCGIDICFDTFAGDVRVCNFGGNGEWRPCTDKDAQDIICRLESCGWKGRLGINQVAEHLRAFAKNNIRDSAVEFLDAEVPEWDGVDRASFFFRDYCGADDTPQARAIGRYLFATLWGRAHSPEGQKADMAVILVGPQGARKSTLARVLAFRSEWSTDAIRLDDSDAAIARNIRGKLTAEIPELNGMTRRGVAELKDFLSKSFDEWTEKYQAFATRQVRRCVYVMTTNERSFLSDSTGNRRMGIVEVKSIDIEKVEADLRQIWAQGRSLFADGGIRRWQTEAEVAVRDSSADYAEVDSWEEIIAEWLPKHEDDDAPLTAKRILSDAIGMDSDRQTRKDSARVCGIMRGLGFEYKMAWSQPSGKSVRQFVKG